MNNYATWITLLILISMISAYCAKLSNMKIPFGGLYVFISSMLGALTWVWVTKVSKNLIFDSLLYDIILVITFTSSFVFLKCGQSFSIMNWIGLITAIIGLILMKV